MVTGTELRTGEVFRPLWQRSRFWVALGGALVVGGLVLALTSSGPGRDLDPSSPAQNGSKALAQVLRGYGTAVTRTSDLSAAAAAGAGTSVLVVEPDVYSQHQLRTLLGRSGRVVLLAPAAQAVSAVSTLHPETPTGSTRSPGCSDAGALATGPVDLPEGTVTYTSAQAGPVSCYGGALVLDDRLAVLGSADLLRNDTVAARGVAALDVNVLTADRTLGRVLWLLPGTDGDGPGAPNLWQLFPPAAHRGFVWLLIVALVIVLWRARRLGPPVTEPLPVVVRAAEVVEGHGRLYRRAGARSRAAGALRSATIRRLAEAAGLPRTAGVDDVVLAAARATGREPTAVRHLLAGPPPTDDPALVALGADLQELERAAGRRPGTRGRE